MSKENSTAKERLYQLRLYQSAPLSVKIKMTRARIREWYDHFGGKVYVAFSGGKDSTVLLDLVWSEYPDVPTVFADTGNELESVLEFVRSYGDKVIWVKPKKTFDEVVAEYGYPVVSKKTARMIADMRMPDGEREESKRLHMTGVTKAGLKCPSWKLAERWKKLITAPFNSTSKCCGYLKIKPFVVYEEETGRRPYVGTMADEGKTRQDSYINNGGCNAFEQRTPTSRPMMFWTEQDVLRYIKEKSLPIAAAYGNILEDADGKLKTTGESRTGCKFCLFGIHMEKGENRIQRLARIEPESYTHAIEELHYDQVLDYLGIDWLPIDVENNKVITKNN